MQFLYYNVLYYQNQPCLAKWKNIIYIIVSLHHCFHNPHTHTHISFNIIGIAICFAFKMYVGINEILYATYTRSIFAYRIYACSRHRSALIFERSVTSCIRTRYTVTWSWYVPGDWSFACLVGRAWFLWRTPRYRGSLTEKPSLTGHLINKNFYVLHVDRCARISFVIISFLSC